MFNLKNCQYKLIQILTSLSEVPHMEQHLHSIHCHLYLRTETIIFAVNCKQVGCPITRTYEYVKGFTGKVGGTDG